MNYVRSSEVNNGMRLNMTSRPARKKLLHLPPVVIFEILRFCDLVPNREASAIFLTCKYCWLLGRPFTLSTVSIRSIKQLEELLGSLSSPFFDKIYASYVHRLQLKISPQSHFLNVPSNLPPIDLPNLREVVFEFRHGVPLNSPSLDDETLLRKLTADSINPRVIFNPQWHRFFSQLNPVEFYWVSPDRDSDLHMVCMGGHFKDMFRTWTKLMRVYLEGICMVEQRNLASWTLCLPSRRVTITGPFWKPGSAILYHPSRTISSKACYVLLLEDTPPNKPPSSERPVPVAMLNHVTYLGLRRFTFSMYHDVVYGLTGVRRRDYFGYENWKWRDVPGPQAEKARTWILHFCYKVMVAIFCVLLARYILAQAKSSGVAVIPLPSLNSGVENIPNIWAIYEKTRHKKAPLVRISHVEHPMTGEPPVVTATTPVYREIHRYKCWGSECYI